VAQTDRYNDRPQLVGKVGRHGFAFCLFDGKFHAPPEPYQASSPHYFFDDRESQLLACLRRYMSLMDHEQLAGRTNYLRRIKDVRPLQYFDAICLVLALDHTHPRLTVLHLWDGSDALPFPLE
jgi:hypothetical protein